MKRFSVDHVAWLEGEKYVKIRAGATHRMINIWIVVIEGRVFARSWNNKPTGWYAAFRTEPDGVLEIRGTKVPVRARTVTADAMLDAVTRSFGEKYTTKANRPYVAGFAEAGRRENTVEFVPL